MFLEQQGQTFQFYCLQSLKSPLLFAHPDKGFSNKERKEAKCSFIYLSVQDIYLSLTCMFPCLEGALCPFHERLKTKFKWFALGFIFFNQLQGSIVVMILQVAFELFENRTPLFLIFFPCLLCRRGIEKSMDQIYCLQQLFTLNTLWHIN